MAGKAWNRSRIGRRTPVTIDPTLGDPAKGERVPRCKVCGMPERPGNKLIPGMWAYLRFHMDLVLCEHCVMESAPGPMLADPLQLEDAA